MRLLCRGDVWRAGLLLLLASCATPRDSRRPASVLRSDFSRIVCDSPSPTAADAAGENLSCESQSLRKLECQWRIPEVSGQSDYKMYLYKQTFTGKPKQPCTCIDDWCATCSGLCCLWKVSPYDPTSPEIMIEIATSTQVCNVTFNHSLIVRPDPAMNLKVNQTGSYQELKVSWETPFYLSQFRPGLFYNVGYRPKNVNVYGPVGWQNETGSYHGRRTTVELTSLHGWVEYEVRVRLRSGARPIPDDGDDDDDGWWSSETSGSAVTPQGAPEVAPAVGVGSFEVESDADPERRAVRLAWRPIPPLLHNGPDLEYHVVVKDETNNTARNFTENGTFVRIDNLNKNSSYRMEVGAANRAGVGNQTAEVRVPADPPPAPLLPAVVYHAGTRQFELRWPAKENLTYTAYVCTDGLSSSSPCATNLYWKNVGSASAVNLTLEEMNVTDSVAPDEVRFALSAETFAGDSSGMTWDSCVHPQRYITQHYPTPEITSAYDSTTSSVSVHWTASCASRGGVIEEVQAIWCEGHGSCVKGGDDIPKKNESDVFSGALSLEGLREGADYTLNLRFKYRGGFSDWSSAQSFSTKSSALPTWLIVTIVIVAIVITVVVLRTGVYSGRKIEVIVREAQREIILPEGLDSQSNPNGMKVWEGIDVMAQSVGTTDSQISNATAVYSQVLPFDKVRLQPLSSEDRDSSQKDVEEYTSLVPHAGYVVPGFTDDIRENGQSSVAEEGNNTTPPIDIPPAYIERSYKVSTNLSSSSRDGLPSPVPVPREDHPSVGYIAIQPHYLGYHASNPYTPTDMASEAGAHDSSVSKSSGVSMNMGEEEKPSAGYVAFPSIPFGTQFPHGSGKIMDRDAQRTCTGYVAFPPTHLGIQTSCGSEENMDRSVQEESSTGYVSFPQAGLSTNTFHSLEEHIDWNGQGKSTGHVISPAAKFGTEMSQGFGENIGGTDQGKSTGYVAFPAADFATQTPHGFGENVVRDDQGISTGYVAFPPADFGAQPSVDSREDKTMYEHRKKFPSPGYVAFPPMDFGTHNPHSLINLEQTNKLSAESERNVKEDTIKQDFSIKNGDYVKIDFLSKLQNTNVETDIMVSPASNRP